MRGNLKPLRSRRRLDPLVPDDTPLSYANKFFSTTDVYDLEKMHSFGERCMPMELNHSKSDAPRVEALCLFDGLHSQWLYTNRGFQHTIGEYVVPIAFGKMKYSGMTIFDLRHRL